VEDSNKIIIKKSYREIDVLIAQHIFDWVKEEKLGMHFLYPRPGFSLGACSYWEPVIWNRLAVADFLPHFSTKIEDSWEIIRKIEWETAFHLSSFADGIYRANFGSSTAVSVESTTIELAICLAALKTKDISLFIGEDIASKNPLAAENEN
jgi:hypothetical protein